MPSLRSFSPPQSEKRTETAKQNSPQRQQIAAAAEYVTPCSVLDITVSNARLLEIQIV